MQPMNSPMGEDKDKEKELREVKVVAQRKFPGRSWGELSDAERREIFIEHKNRQQSAYNLLNMEMPEGKTVGPSGIYVANPWASLATAAAKVYGGYRLGKANQQEATGRQALSDLQTRRDALDRESEQQRLRAEEERRRQWMQGLIGR